MSIQNLQRYDPFADEGNASNESDIHIRIQQRNGKKTLTTVQGIDEKYDKRKILKYCKKEFACNGTVVSREEYGEVIQMQGDQRERIADWLIRNKIADKEKIKVHGF
ncbi:hypothetical protein BOX15_Mlig023505g1 [Macrostomum lignano]|uniref:SUI1 domain-containing protein n=1 Tax=Macrostomum lignano TaxID=282301 RepID=A0A267GTC3_9PLAT|nr:hypothetical protein BOX15_Mlig030974g1 [Macrostomum lignano]PAA82417.1 hypothetical protein BOX15_Mlig023505g2 [Macrostomum lignano]PAA89276.1 hypothetical protein BOX15_Mlig023505g1 [Macrostomum lignano]